MRYKLIDNQHQFEESVFKSKAEVIEHLANYHNYDWNSDEHKDIYTFLDTLKTDDEKLDFLCDYGDWNVYEEYTGAKGEYTKTQQGNFMKVHPLDRI